MDLDAMQQALLPPVEKLQRHGVESVRQRVMNLGEVIPMSIEEVMKALVGHFCCDELILDDRQVSEIEAMENNYEKF